MCSVLLNQAIQFLSLLNYGITVVKRKEITKQEKKITFSSNAVFIYEGLRNSLVVQREVRQI